MSEERSVKPTFIHRSDGEIAARFHEISGHQPGKKS